MRPWHSSPTLRGQLDGESELSWGAGARQWLGEPLPGAMDAANETGRQSRVHTRGCAPPPLQSSLLLDLRLLERRPCSQHTTNSMKHRSPSALVKPGRRQPGSGLGNHCRAPWTRSTRHRQAEQGTHAWARNTAVAAFIVAVSAFDEHRPCSQHANNKHETQCALALLSHAARAAGRRERVKPGATPSNLSRRRRGRRAVAEKAKPSSRGRGDEAVEF